MTAPPTGAPDPRGAMQEQYAQDLAEVARALPGADYRRVLGWIHAFGQPRNYLEIGVNFGKSFALVQPGTHAVGVDPEPKVAERITGRVLRETSDAFFARPDLRAVVEAPVQFAFIDGLHTFDQVLRDFLNVEQISSADSIVALHDIYPIRPEVAARERRRIFWTGDVWKAAAILSRERPDLSFAYVPAPPSGLLLVTALKPAVEPLRQRLDGVVDAWMHRGLPTDPGELVSRFECVGNDEASVRRFVNRAWGARATA